MCRMASYFLNNKKEVTVHDLSSHANTEKHLRLDKSIWFEGHYEPNGNIECRTEDGHSKEMEAEIRYRFPKFTDFLTWAVEKGCVVSGWLDLRGCDLKGVDIPKNLIKKVVK